MKRLLFISLLLSVSFFIQAESYKVALVQAHLEWGNVSANLEAFEKRIGQCSDCDMIVLPELFTVGCDMRKSSDTSKTCTFQSKDEVAALFPSVLERMQKWAMESNALVIGSTIYKEGGKYYNRLLAVYPDGTYLHYDKHNCFKKGSYSSGNKQLVLSWKGHKIATYVCYDLRFADWSRNDGQYDTMIYIANWPESRREDWISLLKERAMENKASVIAVNCSGADPNGLKYAGDSMVISPEGRVIDQCEAYQDQVLGVFVR